jgi:nucleotide sugar dehydrogenase
VGGHCIPIDPNYLSWVVRSLGYRFRFVELAQEVSERMPAYVAKRVQEVLNTDRKAVNGADILVLGVSYKPNVSDQRETPARPLVKLLREMGADVRYNDPHVDEFRVDGDLVEAADDLATAVSEADIVVLLQPHRLILEADVMGAARRIFDTSGVLDGPNVERL